MKFMVPVLAFLFSLSLPAADQICEDLHRFACAPGTYDDGTGSAANMSSMRSTERSLSARIPGLAETKFREALKRPENAQFRRMLRSATGLSMNPDCDDVHERPDNPCLDLLAESAADVMNRALFSTAERGRSALMPLYTQISITDSPVYKGVLRDVVATVRQDPAQKATEARVRDQVFPRVQDLMIKRVSSLVRDESVRRKIIDKIRDIRFRGSACIQGADSDETISDLLSSNANYSSVSNTFTYCSGAMLNNTSEFQMVHTIAHEMSHAIDPCRIDRGANPSFRYPVSATQDLAESSYPFGVLSCLRRFESVAAYRKRRDPPASGAAGPAPAFDGFCQDDQINEAFCDWMAYEVLPEYMKEHHPSLSRQQLRNGYSNVWRGSCSQPKAEDIGKIHPMQSSRVNYLLLMQPEVRRQMGCPEGVQGRIYCDHERTALRWWRPAAPAETESTGTPVGPKGER